MPIGDTLQSDKKFIILNSMNFIGQPDLTTYGLRAVRTDDRHYAKLLPTGAYDANTIDFNSVKKMAADTSLSERMLVLDLEQTNDPNNIWKWDVRNFTPDIVRTSAKNFIDIVDAVHLSRPNLKVGWYGNGFADEYWAPVGNNLATIKSWQSAHAFVRGCLVEPKHLDFLCPSFYTFYDDIKGWEKDAFAVLAEARKWGIPVYPYLWMEYHSSSVYHGQLLPISTWERQLDFCEAYCDGVIIWGGWQKPWVNNAFWFQSILKRL